MLGRAEKVIAGAVVAEGLVAAGTVGPSGRVAAGAVETAEVAGAKGCVTARVVETAEVAGAKSCVAARAVVTAEVAGARRCWAVGATKVERLAEAGCWAAGATKVARLAEADCWVVGATKVARLLGAARAAGTGGCCRECAHSPDIYVAWLRSATAMAAAVERFWASREVKRVSCSLRVRVVSWIPARVVSEERSRAAIFVRRGRSSRSCSAAANPAHVGRQLCVHLRCHPSRRGGRPTSSWPASPGTGCPRRVSGAVGGGGIRRWRHGRLAWVAGKRGATRGCGPFLGRSWREFP